MAAGPRFPRVRVGAAGAISDDGQYVHCTREEYAGDLDLHGTSNTYAHRAIGLCQCGHDHGVARVTALDHRNGCNRDIVAECDYSDEQSRLLFQVVRTVPKGFEQRRPDGAGGWTWNLDGVGRVLYRLPELMAADSSRCVLIVEGEKDVDRLRALGFVATCNPGGAGKWRPEYAEVLSGRNVAILPDNDQPGRAHARTVANSLVGIAGSARMVELTDLPEKGDVSDWLDGGGTAERLRELVKASKPVPEPSPDTDARNGHVSIIGQAESSERDQDEVPLPYPTFGFADAVDAVAHLLIANVQHAVVWRVVAFGTPLCICAGQCRAMSASSGRVAARQWLGPFLNRRRGAAGLEWHQATDALGVLLRRASLATRPRPARSVVPTQSADDGPLKNWQARLSKSGSGKPRLQPGANATGCADSRAHVMLAGS